MNDANQANFDEINGHIKIIKAKMAKSTDSNSKSLADDLEDYYERQLQLRVMHNNTLTLQLESAEQSKALLKRRLWGCVAITVIIAMIIGFGILITVFPATFFGILFSPEARWIAVLCATAALGSAGTWIALSPATKKKSE